ncbi:MAG TPA: hypothetical protein H9875_03860 [Candidatus Levilactobacillus faecigallinarum]|uniref:Uncharacterized protein n=1 Tax=Candidatus Levilactobacillus faecigallinarum TaxID=2838638 RepID=A0A9D1U4C8_9LACO|nr:hypothetical protein [Candidatus Levilactobacillus faecigallinarum]
MTKNKQLLTQLNTLQRRLTPADSRYFDALRTYCTTQRLFSNEVAINTQLLSMLQDLLDAEKDGTDAPTFFGNDPEAMATALLAQLPPAPWRDRFGLIGVIIGITWLSVLMSSPQTTAGMVLYVTPFIVMPIFETVIILLFMRLLHITAFRQRQWLPNVILVAVFLIGVAAYLLCTAWQPLTRWTVTVPEPWNWVITGLFAVMATAVLVWIVAHVRIRSKL